MLTDPARTAVSTAPRPLQTAAEFFEWEAEQLDKHEFYHGEVFSMAGGTPEHALVSANTIGQLVAQLAGGPCRAFSSDLAVEVDEGNHYCYPDLTVVCGPVLRSEHGPAVTNPTVVVEVLSPSTAGWDRGGKLERYRRVPSLQAVVFVSTDHQHAEAIVRDGERWVLLDPDADRQLPLDALGVTLDVPALFEGTDLPVDLPSRSGGPSGPPEGGRGTA